MAVDEVNVASCEQCGGRFVGSHRASPSRWCEWCTDVRKTYNVDANKPRLDVRLPLDELRKFVDAKCKKPAKTIRIFAALPDESVRDVLIAIDRLKPALKLLCTRSSVAQRGEIMLALTAPTASGESSLVLAWTNGARRGRYQLPLHKPLIRFRASAGEVSVELKGVFL